ncbi:AraC family transcriptional regulator [Chryseobacterium lactis]|uniref:AraC family transcriptional regulator n=1 Tax=Chryseobacterium lactis TaxID=1241981 RepID=UPI001C8A2B9A|nr:AraC family transcriptional regulator [Chryseobacterium lactis]
MEEYKKRIVKTIQYIDTHLDEDLSLEKIAEISAYSPFHFHRIFRLITGETLQNYIIRKKIEKSAFFLAMRKEVEIKVGSGEVTLNDFEQCWVSLFLWMNEHGYSMRRTFPFEIYHSNFKEHPEGKMIVDFCIPIQ